MSNKIYVGNLNYETTENELNNLFSQYGSVNDVRIITDKFSGRSKGFGFIEMEEASAGSNAISELNGKEYASRELRVNEAHASRPRF